MTTLPKAKETRRSEPSFVTRWLRRLLVIGAYGYPALLLALCLALRFVGEDWWLTAALLYLPRVVFLLPLVLFVPAVLWPLKRPRLLWTQAAALVLCVFPLMGFVLPWSAPSAEGPTLKVVSFNVNSYYGGVEGLMSSITRAEADLVVLQEAPEWGSALRDRLKATFPHVEQSTQFIIASRFPILERTEPEKLPHWGRQRSPRFMRYLLETPLGKLAVYNVHPISPRGALGVHQMRGLLHSVRTGVVLQGDPATDLVQNSSLRTAQVAAVAAMAAQERSPVLLAGDTNLPGLSAALDRHWGHYTDGFRQASWGFGYTFSARYPLMRLDRMFVGSGLAFSSFEVACHGVSDHLCVQARVFRRN